MLDLEKIRKELDKKAQLKYIKLQKRYQKYYYDYNNLTVILSVDSHDDKASHLSVTRKER